MIDIILRTISMEGGYSNHSYDLGGETKYGISSTFNKDVDVKSLTLVEALSIYDRKYAKLNHAKYLYNRGYTGLAMFIFDSTICGHKPCLASLQHRLNRRLGKDLKVDGIIGSNTREVIEHMSLGFERLILTELLSYVNANANDIDNNMQRSQQRAGREVKSLYNGIRNRIIKRIMHAIESSK